MADTGKRTVKSVTPPPAGGKDDAREPSAGARSGSGSASGTARRSPGRPNQFDKLQAELEDFFGTAAIVQGSMALLSDDARHELGSRVTLEYAPKLAEAWVDLARQDERVLKMLKRLTTGSAWGGVIMTTGGFLLAQAQVYGLMDWATITPAGVPAGDPTDPRANGTGESVPPVPPVPPMSPDGKDPRNSAPDGGVSSDPAQNPAEQQRRAVERRRQQRGS